MDNSSQISSQAILVLIFLTVLIGVVFGYGDFNKQPSPSGYSEVGGADDAYIGFYSDSGYSTLAEQFNLGDTIYVRINTTNVNNCNNKNKMDFKDYQKNNVYQPNNPFSCSTINGRTICDGSAVLSAGNGFSNNEWYGTDIQCDDGTNQVRGGGAILVGTSGAGSHYIRLYNDSSYTAESVWFNSTGRLYFKVYSVATGWDNTRAPRPRDFFGANANPTTYSCSDVGDTYECYYDVNITGFNTEGYWYYLEPRIRDGGGADAYDKISPFYMIDDTGPTTSSVTASPNPTEGASSVTVNATVDDTASNNATVNYANFTVYESNTCSGTVKNTGTMDASDGSFDSSLENVTANISTSTWTLGNNYTVCITGRDIAYNSGGVASVTVEHKILNTPPTTPTNIQCDGSDNCNITVDTSVVLNASGSTDADGDNITYFIEASQLNSTTSDDQEPGEKQAIASAEGVVIGETGSVSIANFQWTLVEFANTYASTPVVIATPVTQNGAVGEDDSYIIPTISMVNTTHFNVTICQDNGATTCDPTVVSETLHYFVFDVDKANQYSWIDVGTVTVATDGTDTTLTYGKTFANVPVIWTTSQTYNQGGNIAAVVWAEDAATKSTTSAPLIGCVHQGTGNACTAGQPSETVGYVAIDTTNVNITSFQIGSADISNSAWTAATFSPTYTNPRVMVTQNDDDGGQDPQYPWARNVVSGGMDFRYCEQDLVDDCDTHTGEVVNWFALEQSNITTFDIEATKDWETYNDVLSSDWKNITELNVTVNVSVYNNSGSTQNGNNDPDLQLEMYNGTDFVRVGNFSVNGIGNFSLTVSDSTILAGWRTIANTDLRIRGVDFDYNDTSNIDEINWTGVWVTVNGSKWTEIGNHTESTTFTWNTTALPEQTGVDLRARAIDLDGSNTYSDYFTKGSYLNISHACSVAIGLSFSSIDWNIVSLPAANQSAQGNNGTGVTQYNVSIEATGCTADLYIRADGNLTSGLDVIGLGNETYRYNTTNNTVPGASYTPLDTDYAGNQIGSNLGNGTYSYLKFFLNVPGGQPAGNYNNTVYIKGVKSGVPP